MNIRLHSQARTTPAVRREIQESSLSDRQLARKHGLTRATVRKWRRRGSVEDASHRPHTLHTTLTAAQEGILVYLRQHLLLPLDDLLVVTREFLNPQVSRSGLDRCLRRHGVANLKALQATPETKPSKAFKAYVPGFVHLDVKYLPAIAGEPRRYLFVAIDRATRWVYVALKRDRSARSAKAFLKAVIQAAPFQIQKCLTDNGSEFTDRFLTRQKQASGQHAFDQVCAEHGIDHRLIPPRHPQTNGMVERFNGRIAEVLQTHHFDSSEELATTLLRYTDLYNHYIPQRALGHLSPIQALKKWQATHPNLFRKKVYHLPGLDNYSAPASQRRG
jgi:transposase InsO family protein